MPGECPPHLDVVLKELVGKLEVGLPPVHPGWGEVELVT